MGAGSTATITSGASGSTTVTLQGTIAALNSALNGLTFQAASGFSGAATLTIVENDLGHSGYGGAMQATATINVNVLATSPIQASGNTVTATGISTGDQFVVSFSSATEYTVSIDKFSQSYSTTSYPNIVLSGDGGTSTATVYPDTFSTASPSTATFQPDSLTYSGAAGYTVTATNVPTITAYGQTGDSAVMYGTSTTANTFTASSPSTSSSSSTPNSATMSDSSGYFNDAVGFTSVYGVSENPTVDVANLYDTTGTTTYVGTPTYSYLMQGPNDPTPFYDAVEYFQNVVASNQASATAGSTDFAVFYDVGVASTFVASQGQTYPVSSTNASMSATGSSTYDNQALNFSDVIGISSNSASVAKLYDSNGNNAFISTQDYATFSPPSFGKQQPEQEYDAQTEFFQQVYGYAATPTDQAFLYGDKNAGNEVFVALAATMAPSTVPPGPPTATRATPRCRELRAAVRSTPRSSTSRTCSASSTEPITPPRCTTTRMARASSAVTSPSATTVSTCTRE